MLSRLYSIFDQSFDFDWIRFSWTWFAFGRKLHFSNRLIQWKKFSEWIKKDSIHRIFDSNSLRKKKRVIESNSKECPFRWQSFTLVRSLLIDIARIFFLSRKREKKRTKLDGLNWIESKRKKNQFNFGSEIKKKRKRSLYCC